MDAREELYSRNLNKHFRVLLATHSSVDPVPSPPRGSSVWSALNHSVFNKMSLLLRSTFSKDEAIVLVS